MEQPRISNRQNRLKRAMDVLGALLGFLISIPVITVAAIAIKLDSPGPVFYRQIRSGCDGQPFTIIKLRTMVVDADLPIETLVIEGSKNVTKAPNDPRVTSVGRLLRRLSLDEAPQFLNVLQGDMSLVGPRPEDTRIVQFYSEEHRQRLAVKPGMTGPMQVNGRGALSAEERLRLELDYIQNYSLWHDCCILLKTLPAIVRGTGAF